MCALAETPKGGTAPVIGHAYFCNRDGHKIFCKSWSPPFEPRALVFVAHGYGDHCSQPGYETLAETLVGLGCFVFAHDHVGQGKSGGPRGTIKSADTYVNDILKHVDMAREKFPNKPVYLFGHSMGGLLVIMAVQRRPKDFAGMVLLAPLLGVDKEEATWCRVTMVRVLGCLCPKFSLGIVSAQTACRDPAVAQQMDNDPLGYHGNVYAGFVAALIRAVESARAKIQAVKVPFLLQHGSADSQCDPAASEEFFEKAPSKDKSLKIYPGAYHSLLHEPGGVAELVLSDIVEWFAARVPHHPIPPPVYPEVAQHVACGSGESIARLIEAGALKS
ncbi:monoglyceride lipase-like [Haemaphysalis longicornis]